MASSPVSLKFNRQATLRQAVIDASALPKGPIAAIALSREAKDFFQSDALIADLFELAVSMQTEINDLKAR